MGEDGRRDAENCERKGGKIMRKREMERKRWRREEENNGRRKWK